MSVLNVDLINVNTIASSTGSTAFTIDSGGRVLMPSKPLFQSRGSATQSITVTGNSLVDFNTSIINVGGNYNTTLEGFTAPILGNYLFGSNTRINGLNMTVAAEYFRLYFGVNGTTSSATFGHSIFNVVNTTGNYVTLNITGIISLSANDYVQVFVYSNSDASYSISTQESQFWGFLIG
jgi:hypothetical protein